ncbi:hypothetical protein OV320_2558 [Actinobacteria bacterium OV320]|jgi:hypothetical protein|nr:hypothetical protein OV320_2558 [Actinobacteria bacterium OV320]
MTTTRTQPEPPAAAVAADAHWSEKMRRLRERSLAETTFVICDDVDVRTRYQRAKRAHEMAQDYVKDHPDDTDAPTEAAKAATEYDEAKTAYDQVAIPLRFRALPRPALEALYRQHKPSETEADDGKEWADTFPPALIAAASVDGMTEGEARELLAAWSLSEANAMFNAAMGVQSTTRADLGKG